MRVDPRRAQPDPRVALSAAANNALGSARWTAPSPVPVRFGVGCWQDAGATTAGRRLLLLTTPGHVERGTAARVAAGWGGGAECTIVAGVAAGAERAVTVRLARTCARRGYDGIVALGGGSVIDTAKVLAAALAGGRATARASSGPAVDGGGVEAWLDGRAALPAGEFLPLHTVPTTAGSGSEVTPFATIWDTVAKRKLSLADARLAPRTAWFDPELTAGLPREAAAAGGLDALSQALESIWNVHAQPASLAWATAGLRRALAVLPRLAAEPEPAAETRAGLMIASLCGGTAIAATRTALAHSISYPLTAHHGLAHGVACSFTLPALLDFNLAADDGRIAAAARAAGCASTADLRARIVALLEAFGVDALLRRHGIGAAAIARVADEMLHPGRADNNLRSATPADVRTILAAAAAYLPALREGGDV